MAGYLDHYGAGDERRARKIKVAILSVVVLAVLSGLLYFVLHNYSQERQAKRFFERLEAHDYQGAYVLWGCTAARPCSGYPMKSFMQDWGPPVNVTGFAILDGESCGNSVIVDVDAGPAGDKKLWVNRNTLELGFPPYDQCPQGNRIYNFFRNVKYHLHGRTYR
jgi:hypothetical protein